jgi:integrase
MRGHVYRRCPTPRPEPCARGRCPHRYAYTFSAGTDPATGRRRQFTRGGFRTRREAEAALRQAIGAAEKGTLKLRRDHRAEQEEKARAAQQRPTLASFLEEWLARGVGTHGTQWRPNTRDGYATNIRLHINPRIGSMAIADVRTTDLQQLLDEMAKPDPHTQKLRSKPTVARVRATLTGVFKAAHRLGLIDRNPAVDLIVTGADSDHEIVVYTPEQLGRLFTVLADDRIGSLYYVDCFTGLRRGELVGLQRNDLDLDAGVVTVRHVITQRGRELRHGRPKTRRGERVVVLDSGTVEVLRRHLARQAAERHAWGDAYQDHGLVWAREDGTPLSPDYVTRHWHALTDRANLPRARLHDLRHTHASHGLAAGVPTKLVSERLGHSSTSFTERVYQHTAPAIAAQAAETIAALTRATASRRPAARPAATKSASKRRPSTGRGPATDGRGQV